MNVLSISGISKRYGGNIVLREVSLDISEGQIVAVVGSNGAGKSTLLRIITGVEKADKGEVLFRDRRIDRATYKHYRFPAQLAAIFQRPRIVDSLSVLDNIRIGWEPGTERSFIRCLLHSGRDARPNDDATKWWRRVTGQKDKNAQALSFGEARMVEMARVAAGQPLAVIMDEPTAGLDARGIEMMGEYIRDLKRLNAIVLVAEHNNQFVRTVCDRVVELRDSRIFLDEAVREWSVRYPEGNGNRDLFGRLEPDTLDDGRKRTNRPLLDISDLEVGYDNNPSVFRSFSLSVPSKHVVALVGENGSGKSTALKAVAGLLPWKKGSVLFDGKLTSSRAMLGKTNGISFVPQSRRVFGELTVGENLRLALRRSTEQKAAQRQLAEILPQLKNSFPIRAQLLSGGEQQVLALVLALLRKPKVLLLDEPAAGLHQTTLVLVQHLLTEFGDHGGAILIAEHDPEFVKRLCNAVVFFEIGTEPRLYLVPETREH
jgi:branched-chain amino acid transport system ATP-binding protein